MPNFLNSTPQDFANALTDVNRKMAEQEAAARALTLGMPYISLHNFPVDLNVLGMFTEAEARQTGAVPFYKEGKDLRIGAIDPDNQLLKEKIKDFSNKNKVKLYLISKFSFDQTLKFYAKVLRPTEHKDDVVRITQEQNYSELFQNLKDPTKQHETATQLLDILLGAAIFYKASDLHLEPEEHFVKARYRLDGVLQDMLHVAKPFQQSLLTRVKILAKLKINVENLPQDGRITFYYLDTPIDVRVSTLPSAYGESVVMRFLGTGATSLKLKDLGMREQDLVIVERAIAKPNGMIVTTGPTGSGKQPRCTRF